MPAISRVVLVPADPEQSGDVLRFIESGVGSDGKFVFAHVPPGRYRAVVSLLAGELSREGNPYPISWNAANRKALLGDDQGAVVELKPCQRIVDYTVRYGK